MPETNDFSPVVQLYLDPYLHNLVDPNHFFGGNSKRLFEFRFLSIQSKAGKQAVNQALIVHIKELVMCSHQIVLNIH